jgi:hypothetical protein
VNQDLFKIFEKYRIGEQAMLCLWVNALLLSSDPLALGIVSVNSYTAVSISATTPNYELLTISK